MDLKGIEITIESDGEKPKENDPKPKKKFDKTKKVFKKKQVDYSKLPPNTIYNAIVATNMEFSRKDLRKISNAVHGKFLKQYGEDKEPDRIEQIENDRTYTVFCYPNKMRREIKNIAAWFFVVKEQRSEKHARLLAYEKLQKLKKSNSPDYEMALVRFNIAEDERLKKEKLQQKAESIKKNNKNNKNNKNKEQNDSKFAKNKKIISRKFSSNKNTHNTKPAYETQPKTDETN